MTSKSGSDTQGIQNLEVIFHVVIFNKIYQPFINIYHNPFG